MNASADSPITMRPERIETLGDLLSWGKEELASLGPHESQICAERLLAELSGLNRSELYLEAHQAIREKTFPGAAMNLFEKFGEFIAKRKARVPVAYILGKASFWNEILEVGPGCLIPRPETEMLIEHFLSNSGFGKQDPFSFLDLGAGTGAIGIAVLRHFTNAKVTFSDISEEALKMTQKNITGYGLAERSSVVLSDLFDSFGGCKWNAILSNPPYLAESDWENAQPEILFEPRVSLDGGTDGLDFYRSIIQEAPNHLETGGMIALEVGMGQAEKICGLLSKQPFKNISVHKDLAGIDRVVMANLSF